LVLRSIYQEGVGVCCSTVTKVVSLCVAGVSLITDIVGVVNKTFCRLRIIRWTYGVYLNESVITAGNKRANYVALVGINYTCSSITTRLNNIINVVTDTELLELLIRQILGLVLMATAVRSLRVVGCVK
jgi:hypothetical protein